MPKELPDIQHSVKPEFPIYIQQVGVSNVKVPFLLKTKNGEILSLNGNVTMATDLNSEMKGISMSMLLRTLINYTNQPLRNEIIKKILNEFKSAVETNSNKSMLRFEFEYPIIRTAPISKMSFPQYYKCAFEGRLNGDLFSFYEKIYVQYASYCPCSASLCEHAGEGYPHAQRSFAEITVEVIPPTNLETPVHTIWLEDLIDSIEDSVKTAPFPILRRVDEQQMAIIAGKNPMFVEDAIRRITNTLQNYNGISDWIVKTTHQESIHTSDAISVNWKGISGGFDGSFYL